MHEPHHSLLCASWPPSQRNRDSPVTSTGWKQNAYCSCNSWANAPHPLPLNGPHSCPITELPGDMFWGTRLRPGSLSKLSIAPPPKPRQSCKSSSLVYPSSGRYGKTGTELMRWTKLHPLLGRAGECAWHKSCP